MQAIMKYLLIFVLAPIFSAKAQLNKLHGTWISTKSQSIHIESQNTTRGGYSILSNLKSDLLCKAMVTKDTLKFRYEYSTLSKSGKVIHHADFYNFLIKSVTDSFLLLIPQSVLAKSYFSNTSSLHLIRQNYSTDTSLNFERIIFNTTLCLGTCPAYHLEVDKNKNVKFYSQSIIMFDSSGIEKPDTAKQGYYSGTLDDSTFKSLNHAIQTSNLRHFQLQPGLEYDGSTITIILYFENQRKHLQSMSPPEVLTNLITILYQICESNKFQKIPETFQIEEY
jgi:hypothetical protein